MASGIVQVPTDGVGKKVDTTELTVGANTVERQRINLAGAAAGDLAPVDATKGLKVDSYQAVAATATMTTKASSATSAQALASTAGRIGVRFENDADKICYLKYGTTAVATDYTVKLLPGASYDMPVPIYTGRIDCIWTSGPTGTLYITELTA